MCTSANFGSIKCKRNVNEKCKRKQIVQNLRVYRLLFNVLFL